MPLFSITNAFLLNVQQWLFLSEKALNLYFQTLLSHCCHSRPDNIGEMTFYDNPSRQFKPSIMLYSRSQNLNAHMASSSIQI